MPDTRLSLAMWLPRALFVACCALTAASSLACDPATEVTVENRLTESVDVYEGGHLVVEELGLRKHFEYLVMEYDAPTTYEARDTHGQVLSSVILTWEQLKERDFRITFE